MTVATGTRLGAYEIAGPLGTGGMGEVYRARDAKLNRDVAIKVLPEIFARDPERLSRFEREALVLASLNHPNITQIYGVEEANGVRALVMELVEGPTLADRIARGPIPIDEALPIARQVVEALEAAHEHGIIHRDLKPANIKVRSDGTVKVLDFGLAKSIDPRGESGIALADSPTFTSPATQMGVILGTAAYMAPEQVKGKTVDKRADIWAFGVVLFEALTGRHLFEGETVADVLAAIVTCDPDWKKLPAATSDSVRRLLRRCLEPDPARRLRDIGDARTELDDAISGADAAQGGRDRPIGVARKLPWVLTTVVFLTFVVLLWRSFHTAAPVPQRTTRLSVVTQPLAILEHAASPALALSPDGAYLAYVAGNSSVGQLYLRDMNSLEARLIAGAERVSGPFFSPGGEWLAFFARGKLQRISLRGGAPVDVCALPLPASYGGHGGSWGDDGNIVFQNGPGMWRVSADGGTPKAVGTQEIGRAWLWPEVLPGSKAMILTGLAASESGQAPRQGIWALSFETGRLRLLVASAHTSQSSVPEAGIARYVRSGHLVYASQGSLLAVPFDIERLELTGPSVPVIPRAMMGLPGEPGAAQFAVSRSGTLAYLAGPLLSDRRKLVWVNRKGQEEALPLDVRQFGWPRLSPDGSRLALTISDEYGRGDLWIYHLARRTLTRLTFDGACADGRPLWTPDGQRVVFRSFRDGPQKSNLFWKAADGTGQDERLISESNRDRSAKSFSPDGRRLAFVQWNQGTTYDVHLLDMSGQRSSRPLVQMPFIEGSPAISPDGRWLAYRSNETGRYEVYVRPFADVDKGRWQVSTDGGNAPVWSPHGRELFFQNGETMMVAAVPAGAAFVAGPPKVLFAGTYYGFALSTGLRHFDIAPDGRRFIMIKQAASALEESARDELTVVLNWFEELRQLAPAGK